jgi:serine/threonine-protein kinase
MSHLICPNGHSVTTADSPCPICNTLVDADPLPKPTTPALPTVPGYEILGELGRGGMGVVYKARHLGLKRLVALKMIRDGALAGPDDLARFQGEAEAVARLQHPNIVQIFEVGRHDGRPYFSLEYVDDGSLAERLAGAPQPPQEAARLVAVLARAMHSAHQQGVIHRDLKPANVLLTRDGTPKVGDFGLARLADHGESLTHTGAVLGTPSYMAPEQAGGKGNKPIGPATDVYALGAILYELLTGRPPFRGTSSIATLHQVLFEEPVPPSRLQPQVPRALEAVCLRCLAKDAARRYASAAALADDLEAWRAGRPTDTRPSSATAATFVHRHRRAAAAVLLLALVLGGAAVWYVNNPPRPEAEPPPRQHVETPPPQKDAPPQKLPDQPQPEPKSRKPQDVYRRTLQAAALILVKDDAGHWQNASGVLVDLERGLLLTTRSVIIEGEEAFAFFPLHEQGKLVRDSDAYYVGPGGGAVSCRLVATDKRRNLTLVQLDALPIDAHVLPFSTTLPESEAPAYVVSNPGQGDRWVFSAGKVLKTYRAQRPEQPGPREDQPEAMLVEATNVISFGSAGGPLVNDRGALIGIAYAFQRNSTPQTSLFISAREIVDFLNEHLQSTAGEGN